MKPVIFTREKFDRYAARHVAGYREAALAVAEISESAIIIQGNDFESLRLKFTVTPRYGLGDAVAAFAQPIAKVIDATLGTNLEGCGSCAERRDALNRLVPDVAHPLAVKQPLLRPRPHD